VSDVVDVMWTSLSNSSEGLAPHGDLLLEAGHGVGTSVGKSRLDTSKNLGEDLLGATLILNKTLNSLRDHLLLLLACEGLRGVGLGVISVVSNAGSASLSHSTARAHATNGLVLLTVGSNDLARGLGGTRQGASEHDTSSTNSKDLDNVTRSTDTSISNNRDEVARVLNKRYRELFSLHDSDPVESTYSNSSPDFIDSSELRNTVASDLAGGADRSRSDADLQAVRLEVALQQIFGRVVRSNVTNNDLDLVAKSLSEALNLNLGGLAGTVRRVEDKYLATALVDQQVSTLQILGTETDSSTDKEVTILIQREGVSLFVVVLDVVPNVHANKLVLWGKKVSIGEYNLLLGIVILCESTNCR
jgi:hypothetical protein